jgi:hypothetical protein
MQHGGAVTARGGQCQIQRVRHIARRHRGAQLPRDDVAGIVVEHGREVNPAPTDQLEIGKIGLPHLIRAGGFGVELVASIDDDIGRAGDQILRFEQAIDRGLADKVLLLIGKFGRQFARRVRCSPEPCR